MEKEITYKGDKVRIEKSRVVDVSKESLTYDLKKVGKSSATGTTKWFKED